MGGQGIKSISESHSSPRIWSYPRTLPYSCPRPRNHKMPAPWTSVVWGVTRSLPHWTRSQVV